MADSTPIIVGAGITGSGNSGEIAYFQSNGVITGVPNSSVLAGGQVGGVCLGRRLRGIEREADLAEAGGGARKTRRIGYHLYLIL